MSGTLAVAYGLMALHVQARTLCTADRALAAVRAQAPRGVVITPEVIIETVNRAIDQIVAEGNQQEGDDS